MTGYPGNPKYYSYPGKAIARFQNMREKAYDYKLVFKGLTEQQDNTRSYLDFLKEERIQSKDEHIHELEQNQPISFKTKVIII
jgi:hypothetical protein